MARKRQIDKEDEVAEEEPKEEDFDYSAFVDSSDYEDSEYEEDLDVSSDSVYVEETPADWMDN